ncbi:murein hydrolase activator EnvC family protein [Streptomyces sp. NPDC088816]|uniref:murein hydrolase activator EnvC family protein n=1 Tax=Streptomyces sp. NPDC088816 TaxID=3365906 RepID=UPI0038183522
MRWTGAGVRRRLLRRREAAPATSVALMASPALMASVLLMTLTASATPAGSATPTGSATSAGSATRTAWADAGPAAPGDPPVPAMGRAWPVGVRPGVLRGWDPPATVYGPGHRGVDLAAPPGAQVRAVAAGRVFFAGPVAGRGVVSIELTGTGEPPLRTTYEPVTASVKQGDEVAAGAVVGTVEATGRHCEGPCLHWGLLRGTTYLNPLLLLPPWLLNGPTRLLPVLEVPLP